MVFHLPDPRDNPVAHVVENIHSALTGRNPIRELTNGFHDNDLVENIFADVIDNTYGRSGAERNHWNRTPDIQDDFGIDYSRDRYDRNQQPDFNRTSSELMSTLYKYSGEINGGKYNGQISRRNLENYLALAGDSISPQDQADLRLVKDQFANIARGDKQRGISYEDMARFVKVNRNEDQEVESYRWLRQENARLKQELHRYVRGFARGDERGDQRGDERGYGRGFEPGEQRGNRYADEPEQRDSSKVITDKTGPNGHYRAEGADLPLSQEEFKAHYGIPQNIDLTKFMRGKNNDGTVPNFWTSEVAAGLGGRDDNNNLRWDNPAHHEASLDFQRNFAQLAEYFDKLPIQQQMEFTFNFARTQGEVLRSNGVSLLAADNEKIQITESGVTKYIDLVQDVDSDRKLLQWG